MGKYITESVDHKSAGVLMPTRLGVDLRMDFCEVVNKNWNDQI